MCGLLTVCPSFASGPDRAADIKSQSSLISASTELQEVRPIRTARDAVYAEQHTEGILARLGSSVTRRTVRFTVPLVVATEHVAEADNRQSTTANAGYSYLQSPYA
jgi:hypothetical protein